MVSGYGYLVSVLKQAHYTYSFSSGKLSILRRTPDIQEFYRIEANGKTVRVISTAAEYWILIATGLNFNTPAIEAKGLDLHQANEAAFSYMLIKWLYGKGGEPPTWETFLKVLNKVHLSELAHQLLVVLCE